MSIDVTKEDDALDAYFALDEDESGGVHVQVPGFSGIARTQCAFLAVSERLRSSQGTKDLSK